MQPYVLKGHDRPVTIVRFNYDGDIFFSGSAESKINLWDSYTGERIGSYNTRAAIKSLDVDINSKYLISCSFDGTLEVKSYIIAGVRRTNRCITKAYSFRI